MEKLQLSARAYTKVLKVARTIADLAGKSDIELAHLAEAIHFRALDHPVIAPSKPATSTYQFNRANHEHHF